MKFRFCDLKKDFVTSCLEEAKKYPEMYMKHEFNGHIGSILKLPLKKSAVVSPANSLGTMGGGIDALYDRKMFPRVSKLVRAQTAAYGHALSGVLNVGHIKATHWLPIGSASIIPLLPYKNYTDSVLVSAPTMFLPKRIQGTNNPYLAFLATLQVLEKAKLLDKLTIVCPGLGTGCGKISGEEAAKQIIKAIVDFEAGYRLADERPDNLALVLAPIQKD